MKTIYFYVWNLEEETFTHGDAYPTTLPAFVKDTKCYLQLTSRVTVGREGLHSETIKAWFQHGAWASCIFTCIFSYSYNIYHQGQYSYVSQGNFCTKILSVMKGRTV